MISDPPAIPPERRGRRLVTALLRWCDAAAGASRAEAGPSGAVDWVRMIPYVGLHLMSLGLIRDLRPVPAHVRHHSTAPEEAAASPTPLPGRQS